MGSNPYRWQHDQPAHLVVRNDLETLEALSGGNPALATYGLEQLWESDGQPIQVLRTAFGEFTSRHGDFLRAVHDAVSHRGLVAAPGRILEIVRQRAGSVPQQVLREVYGT